MTYTRRDLLRMTALTVTATGIGPQLLGAQAPAGAAPQTAGQPAGQQPATPTAPPPAKPVFTDLRGNVGFFTARGGTIAYLIDGGSVLVVDTQFPDTAKMFVDGLKARAANAAIAAVINTHHHGDHTGGNGVLKEAGQAKTIVAYQRVPELMKAAAARAAQQNPSATPPPMVPADQTFPEHYKTTVGAETVSAHHYGPGHTGGDSVVVFERANVVHMGDLMFNRMQPFVDRLGGASIANWIVTLDKVMKAHANDTIFIFGHSNPKFQVTGSKADLAVQRDFFNALLDFTRAKVKAGTPRDVFIKLTDTLPNFPDHGPLINRALEGAFDEVTASA
jgi:cyclase